MRLRAGLAVVVGVVLAGPSTAVAFPVVSGELDHAWVNVFETGAPENTNRTWLGYSTGPTPANANGTVSPILPGSGPTVSLASPRGADQIFTWRHPAAALGGSYDPATRKGTLEFTGGMRFQAPPFPTGHDFTITVENPKVVLNGASGQLFASGTQSEAKTYDRSQPVYDLDLSAATFTDTPTSTTITGIVPRIATEGYVYPATYAKGAGPGLMPNTFGSFSLTVSVTPLSQPPPAATPVPTVAPSPTPTPAVTATPAPAAPPRASALRLSRKRLRFKLSRPARTRVRIDRHTFTVPARGRAVSVRVHLKPGRHRVTVTPAGGDPLGRRFRLR